MIKIKFKLQDFFIGVYWRTEHYYVNGNLRAQLNIWVLIVPCFPIHIRIGWRV